jgi:DNA-binding NarL/FixJ family response regulator
MKTQVSQLSPVHRPAPRQHFSTTVDGTARRPRTARIRIVVADDHPITLAGLETLFSGERDLGVVARCVDGNEAIRAVASHRPDVLVVDQDMPGIGGAEILKRLRSSGDKTPTVLLATTHNEKLIEALNLDVEGVVFKHSDPAQLVRCVREVRAGRRWLDSSITSNGHASASGRVLATLTRRQIEVARAAVSGLSNKELAQRLGVSEGTIKNHLHAIYERLSLDGRLSLLLHLKHEASA